MQPTPKEGTPIHFRNIKEGDTIRSIQTKDCGTTIIIEGKVHSLCGDTLHFGEVKQGVSSAAIINNIGFRQSSLPTFYLLHRPSEESPISLLRTLPVNSPVEVHVGRTKARGEYTLKGKMTERIELSSGDFRYAIKGQYTNERTTLEHPVLLYIPEQDILKLFVLPSSPPPSKASPCTC